MRAVDQICLAGYPAEGAAADKPYGKNEDWLAFSNYNYALLMDGSTGLGGQVVPQADRYNSTAQWFVHRFAELIEERIDSFVPLKDLIRSCMDTMRPEYEQTLSTLHPDLSVLSEDELRLMQPSASMVLVRKREDKIDLFSLGDLCVLAETCDGQLHDLSCKSVQPLDRAVIDLLKQECQERNLSIAEGMKLPAVQELLHANRLLKNSGKPNGYWILGFDPQALDHAVTAQWDDAVLPPSDDASARSGYIDSLLICSDGFAALYDTYGQFSPAGVDDARAFFNACGRQGFTPLAKTLRGIEQKDSDCSTYPRFKRSDDAAAMMLHFRNRIRTYDKEEKKTKFNVSIHRAKGRLQSTAMSFGVTKAAILAVATSAIAVIQNLIKLFSSAKQTFSFDWVVYIVAVIAAAYAIASTVREYRRRADGTVVLTDSAAKEELQHALQLGPREERDSFHLLRFHNGADDELYCESDSFNRYLQGGGKILFSEIPRSYELPDAVKPLVPAIMEATFRSPNLIFNGRLLRQASHIDISSRTLPRVLVQKTNYFSGQCSHEIAYKQFIIPGGIGVGFNGKELLANEKDVLYDLTRSPCANFLGISTLVVTRDHKLIIGKQAVYSKANKGRYAPSGSGSVDYADTKKACRYYGKPKSELTFNELLTYAMEREFSEECNFELERARTGMATALIGYVRLLERGGKPDYFGISYLNADVRDVQMDIRKSEYGLVGRMLTFHFDSYDQIPDILERFCQEHLETRQVSIQLYLIAKYLKTMRDEGRLAPMLEALKKQLP